MTRKDQPITPFQKRVLDIYYSNGCESIKAYCKAKGIKEPKDEKRRVSISNMVGNIKSGNPEYVAKLEKKNETKLEKMKDKLITQLEDVSSSYFQLLQLAMANELSEEDESRFKRMKSIMTTKDVNKAVELIARMTGAFEPEKHEVTNEFKVSFGEAPKVQQNTKPIIDITQEEDDEE